MRQSLAKDCTAVNDILCHLSHGGILAKDLAKQCDLFRSDHGGAVLSIPYKLLVIVSVIDGLRVF